MSHAAVHSREVPAGPGSVRVIRQLLLLLLGGIFLLAGLLKVLIFNNFVESTATFLGVSAPLSHVAAALVIATEVGVGAAFLLKRALRVVCAVTAVLLVLFIVVLAHAELTGVVAACHCFGTTTMNFSYTTQIGIDLVLLSMLAFLARTTPRKAPS